MIVQLKIRNPKDAAGAAGAFCPLSSYLQLYRLLPSLRTWVVVLLLRLVSCHLSC